jgi:hypothetical protein
MENEEIIKIILAYEQELKENYDDNRDAFGHADKSTDRAVAKWLVISELLERLNIES